MAALPPERAASYLKTLRALIGVARAGAHFPDVRRLDERLAALAAAGAPLELDPRCGLPRLGEVPPALELKLRRRRAGRVQLEIVCDSLTGAEGGWVRHTLLVAQRGPRLAELRGDAPVPTEKLRTLAGRVADVDAETTFLGLAELEGVSVEEVVRGQLGPLHFPGAELPAILRGPIGAAAGGYVLHLVFERAGQAVAESRSRDPFGGLAREALEARRQALGYRVARERRLVCTPSVEEPLRAALARAGTPLVVRSA